VTKKIILLVLLVASAAIAAEAFSQGTPGSSASDKSGPSAEKKPADVSPAPSRNVPPAIFSPSKSDVPAPSKDKKRQRYLAAQDIPDIECFADFECRGGGES